MDKDLGKNHWLKAARMAWLGGSARGEAGAELARDQGSSYWHFKDRDELLDLLLREWESEMAEIIPRLGRRSVRETLLTLVRILVERARG